MAELIAIPLKKPTDVDIVKPLSNVIKSSYNSANDQKDYSEAINEFSKLRNNAVWRAFEKHESSLEVNYNYYDQLCALEEKIPAHELQIPFKWKDAFDRTIFGGKLSLTVSTLAYEKMCVLFNIAALQSSVAASQNLDSDEGLKLAAKLFQQSAKIFNYLKENVMLAIQQEPTPDMSPDTLTALSSLMLAQAQEIFVHKAIYDQMKDEIIAKLAAQAEEFYCDASKHFAKEVFRAFWDKEWVPLIAGKQYAFRAIAELHQASVSKNKKLIGQEIARLEKAVEMFKAAQSKSNKPHLFQDFANKAQIHYNSIKKDNDFIYHERIPDYKTLPPISKAAIAKITPLTTPFSTHFKDLFEDLLPVNVHHALSTYEMKRNEFVNGEITKMRELTQILNGVLASLNLPAAIEDISGTEVPQSLLEKAAYVRSEGGIAALEKAMNELPDLLQRNKDILDEAERMLNEEKESDDRLREQFKERWTRLPSAKLTEQFNINAQKYRGIINNAVNADKIVRQTLEANRQGMMILSMDESELASAIPNGSAVQESGVVDELRKLMQQVEELKSERDAFEAELKSATIDMKSTFLSALAKDGVINEPNLTVEGIGECYGPIQKKIRQNAERQQKVISEIQVKHEEFTREQSGSGSSREEMLRKLASAHDAFKELKSMLKEGAKFYNDLTQLLVVFQNKISDFCFARKTEKEELLKDLTSQAGQSGPAQTPNLPSHHTNAPSQPDSAKAPAMNSLPYPTSFQGSMPMPYSPAPTVPYPAYMPPPMPTAYNPYATLPYPNQGVYNYQQPGQPQVPYGGYVTMPRYGGNNPPDGNNPWYNI